jgi:hypothetical protein
MANEPFDVHEEVRVAIIGLGNRGGGMLQRFFPIPGVRVTALCDIVPSRVEARAAQVVDAGFPEPAKYSDGEEDFLNLLERDDVDIAYICTPWEWHYPQAKAAMENGKHAWVELPIATELREIWDLVLTSERTRKHCMLAENSNYREEELRLLNVVREGLFGELLHGSGGYVHDLRWPYLFGGRYHPEGWRRHHHTRKNANHYPMHGLATVGVPMSINRGDRFDRMMAVSSPALGLNLFRENDPRVGPDHPAWDDDEYITGDRVTCFIQTVNDKFLRSDHDVTSPHPRSRDHSLAGTQGVWGGSVDLDGTQYGPRVGRIYLESLGHTNHRWRVFSADNFGQYDHWLWQDIGDSAVEFGGHGGSDFIMIWRTMQLMQLGLTPDIDVYDSASWCAVAPLSHTSITSGSRVVKMPDFTRGHWEEGRLGLDRGRPD